MSEMKILTQSDVEAKYGNLEVIASGGEGTSYLGTNENKLVLLKELYVNVPKNARSRLFESYDKL